MPNMWTFKYRDGLGKNHGPLPMRGPTSAEEAMVHANMYLNSLAQRAINSGAKDPELKLIEESLEPAGTDEATPIGAWRPPGAKPVDLDQFAKKDDSDTVL